MTSPWLRLSSATTFALLFAVCASHAQTPLKGVRVATGLLRPVQTIAPPGDRDRLFIVEQRGLIKILKLKTGEILATPFLNLLDVVYDNGNEQGLLGLTFHPDYWNNGYFYVNYTREPDAATVVERYTVRAANPDRGNKTTAFLILGPVAQPYSNHNGGCLRFGPNDGYLYIGLGDGGSAGNPDCSAQKGDTFLGKMLRIDVDGGSPYVVPPDNPFVGDDGILDEIWSVGLRNPWRYNFDRLTGDLYIGDVGQDAREEIDFEPGTSFGGLNYGWKIMEGLSCFSTGNCPPVPPCNDPALTLPIHQYTHGTGCSITGGAIYRGCGIPDLRGTYFFADYCSDRIWSFRYDGSNMTDFVERTSELDPSDSNINEISSMDEDADGEIYLSDLNGEIFKIVADAPPPAEDLGFAKGNGAGIAPEYTACGLLDSGNEALLRVRFAPPFAPAALVISTQFNPTNAFGGTLVPIPILFIHVFLLDSSGEIALTAPGGGGPLDIYSQWVITDVTATSNTTISNALKLMFQQ